MTKKLYVFLAFVLITSMVLATGGAASVEAADGDRVQVRWYVGLGTGTAPEQIPVQEAIVEQFNASQDEIELVIEFVDYEQAYDQLQTQIAAGNPPDIIGPVGTEGGNAFSDMFLNIEPYLEGYDYSDYAPGSVDAYRDASGNLVGLPFAVFPAVVFYNRDIFDEAEMAYPPHKFGEAYADGDEWTFEKLQEVAMELTVDTNGYTASEDGFDADAIEQFGYHVTWPSPRAVGAQFGSGNLVAEDGTAKLPEAWRAGWTYDFEGRHVYHFIPDTTYENSDLLAAGNPFDSNNLAMANVNTWYTCCLWSVPNWDVAVVPAYEGVQTARLNADTFRILSSTKDAEASVTVLKYLTDIAAGELLQAYGGMPARESLQDAFFVGLDENFPYDIDWQVVKDSVGYPDSPSFESNMPNFAKARDRLDAFFSLYTTDPTVDIVAEMDSLEADLTTIFAE